MRSALLRTAALRSALESAGYTEQAVCRRLHLAGLSEYRLEGPRHLEGEPDDALGLLIWLLIEGAPISSAGASRVPLQELEALHDSGALSDEEYAGKRAQIIAEI